MRIRLPDNTSGDYTSSVTQFDAGFSSSLCRFER